MRGKIFTAGLLVAAAGLVPSLALEPAARAEKKTDPAGQELRRFDGHTGEVYCVAFTPDGQTAVSGSEDKTLRFWDVATGKQRRRLDVGRVPGLALSPDGRRLLYGVLGDKFSGFFLWEPVNDKVVRSFAGGETWSNVAAFSPDGKQVLGNGHGNTLFLWDVDEGTVLRRITAPGWITGFAVSADFHQAVSYSRWDKVVRLWDVDSGESLRTLEGHADGVLTVACSPDRHRAVSGGKDRTIRSWDTESGKELHCLRGHDDVVRSVAFSPDGKRLLSASADKTVRLWDVGSGKEICCFRGHTGSVGSVAISPDGQLALSAGVDRSIRLWRLPKRIAQEKQGKQEVGVPQANDKENAAQTERAAGADDNKAPEGFQALFNGKDLTGWKVYDGKMDIWGAGDGLLYVKGGGGGWLMTEKEYGDFELRLEYRMPKMGNSGVAIRSPLEGNPAFDGMEIQLLDDDNWKGLKPTQFCGSIYDVVPPSKHVTKPAGEWNAMRITAKGRQITVELNGTRIVDANLDDYKDRVKADREKKLAAHPGLPRSTGHLGLQSYNYRVDFRNLYVKPL